MPRKRQDGGECLSQPIALRVTPTMLDRLEAVSRRTGLDLSNLVRLLISDALPRYETAQARPTG